MKQPFTLRTLPYVQKIFRLTVTKRQTSMVDFAAAGTSVQPKAANVNASATNKTPLSRSE